MRGRKNTAPETHPCDRCGLLIATKAPLCANCGRAVTLPINEPKLELKHVLKLLGEAVDILDGITNPRSKRPGVSDSEREFISCQAELIVERAFVLTRLIRKIPDVIGEEESNG